MGKTVKKKAFKATESFKKMVTNKGLMSDEQYKALLKNQSCDMKNVPDKQMQYLLTNNLIKEV